MNYFYYIWCGIAAYLLVINLIAGIAAAVDKRKAIKGKWRISEFTLLLLGFLGGALLEFIVMLKIRHKTQHMKFMVLLPIFILLHIAILVFILWIFIK